MDVPDENVSKQEKAKFLAAKKVAQDFIFDGFTVGVGTGSTIKYFIHSLQELVQTEELDIVVIPSSVETHLELVRAGLAVSSLLECSELDVYVDGADIITDNHVLIKGGGGALTQEKILYKAAQEFIVIADFTKYPKELTSFPVPIEIIKIAINTVIEPIFNLGGEFKLRYGTGKHGPIITDNGNLIGDITFQEDFNPFEMEKELNNIPGIIENGLFPYGADKVIIGHEETVEIIVRNPLIKEEQL